jgi:hypothetical protein
MRAQSDAVTKFTALLLKKFNPLVLVTLGPGLLTIRFLSLQYPLN